MKKLFLAGTVLAAVLSLSSCKSSSSSFEQEVKKRAEYMCKIQQLTTKAATDESVVKDLEKVKKEMNDFDSTMEIKYKDKKPDDKMSAQAEKIIKEVMDNCK